MQRLETMRMFQGEIQKQREMRMQKEAQKREEEEFFKNQILQKYKESQEVERMNDMKRRQLLIQYKEELDQ